MTSSAVNVKIKIGHHVHFCILGTLENQFSRSTKLTAHRVCHAVVVSCHCQLSLPIDIANYIVLNVLYARSFKSHICLGFKALTLSTHRSFSLSCGALHLNLLTSASQPF